MLLERFERHDVEGAFVGGREDHVGGRAVLVGAKPVGGGHAPAVAGVEAGEAVLGHRGAEVVADGTLVLEELGGHHGADGVAAAVVGTGSTASVPVEAGHGVHAAGLKLLPQDAAIVHEMSIPPVSNSEIADRLEAFASLLELSDANPYTARAYRRAAETIRGSAAPVEELVRSGRVRSLRGIGRSIETKLRELVETGQIAELAELERELSPDMVGLGRYLGLGAKRSVEIARALDVRTAEELRAAAAAGRLRDVPGIGPKREAELLGALAREGEPRPRRGLTIKNAWELVGGVATALGGEVAGDVRRWCDSSRGADGGPRSV